MVLTQSTMLALGSKLPAFELLNTINGQKFNSNFLDSNKGKVVMFICNHCPYVIHYHQQIIDISSEYADDLEFVAISANDILNYPEDSPEKMRELANKLNFNFPYLFDKTQEIAKLFKAACTPEFYLFDENNLLIYRGRLDDSTPGSNKEITGKDLRLAINNFLAGEAISELQHPSMGCNIKWKS